MKHLIVYILWITIAPNVFGQQNVQDYIDQGIKFHDAGKYNEAIEAYNSALQIDNKSTAANYEIAFTYFTIQQYSKAIKYSTTVIKQNTANVHEAYVVLGNSLDMLGKHSKAIKIYEEGLIKFPNSNLLNYNLALTAYNQHDYEKSEKAAINAIMAKPEHASSHIILAAIMQQKGQRIKSILPLYYFLMLEPTSDRANNAYLNLKNQLVKGVEKKDEMNINVLFTMPEDKDEFGAAELMISLLAASKHTEENKNKGEMEHFVETTQSIFDILGELKKENKGFWWDFYVSTFYDLSKSKHVEAFSYYIAQSTNSDQVNSWFKENGEKMWHLTEWLKKQKNK